MSNNHKTCHNKGSDIFKNCVIHIVPADLGKKRMTLFETQISKNGGIIVDKLSSNNITHIVFQDSILTDAKRCGKLLNGIALDGLKVVGTLWISKCLKENKCIDTKDFEMKECCWVSEEFNMLLKFVL